MMLVCERCDKELERTMVRVEHDQYRNCGDHDEKVLVFGAVFCSFVCLRKWLEREGF